MYMYLPPHFKEEDPATLHDLMVAHRDPYGTHSCWWAISTPSSTWLMQSLRSVPVFSTSDGEERIVELLYAQIDPSEFSRQVLSPGARRLITLRLGEVGWNDLSDPSKAALGFLAGRLAGEPQEKPREPLRIGCQAQSRKAPVRANRLQWLRLTVEVTGAFVIAVGTVVAIYGFGRALILQRPEDYVEVRLTLARYLALAIEFELAADIFSTAIAPSWDQIGKLGAIVSNPHGAQLLSHARNERRATQRRRANCSNIRRNSNMNVLAIDTGGTHVKILASGNKTHREFPSGPTLTPKRMVSAVRKLAGDWKFDAVSIGYPGLVVHGHPVLEPHNLGKGWVGFDFAAAFKLPVKVINDAAMQALGSYKGGKMLFLGLGIGLGAAMIVDGLVVPMELAHLPSKKGHSRIMWGFGD